MSEFVHEEATGTSARQASPARVVRPSPVATPERRADASQAARTRSASNASARETAGGGSHAASSTDRDLGDDHLFGEILGGLLGGGAGAAIGGLIGGGVGAVIGGILGAVAGGIIGHLASRRTVTINVTKLAGVADTVGVDVARANTVYRQASLHVQTAAIQTLTTAESNAILGADGALDNFSGNALTAEETTLIGHNRVPGRITAYYVPKFRDPGLRGRRSGPPASESGTVGRRRGIHEEARYLGARARSCIDERREPSVRRLEPHGQRSDPELHGHADAGADQRHPKQPVRPMSDIGRSGEPDATRPDQEARDLFERFSAAMRRDDVAEARSLAPGVDIETEGWPYEDETGPLNPDAFRSGDPRDHHAIATERLPSGGLVIRTGITYVEIERRDGRLVIVRGYHKPIE